jgi:hypothetical protein
MSSQLIVFVAYNVIPRSDEEGWALLRCMRSFTVVDLYLSFEAHMEQTLAACQRELNDFARRMTVRILLFQYLLYTMSADYDILSSNISIYLTKCQKTRAKRENCGTFQRCMHWCIALIT